MYCRLVWQTIPRRNEINSKTKKRPSRNTACRRLTVLVFHVCFSFIFQSDTTVGSVCFELWRRRNLRHCRAILYGAMAAKKNYRYYLGQRHILKHKLKSACDHTWYKVTFCIQLQQARFVHAHASTLVPGNVVLWLR